MRWMSCWKTHKIRGEITITGALDLWCQSIFACLPHLTLNPLLPPPPKLSAGAAGARGGLGVDAGWKVFFRGEMTLNVAAMKKTHDVKASRVNKAAR